ncbi:hypothetical protein C8J56DRAFT_151454 [Mycena floridula]|nr:hypothetical protein C8J56DRAFT_151454 [Mycena floridula]
MWNTTTTVSLSRQVTTTKEATLALFHDPVAMCKLNPLVTKVEQDPADPSLYTVTDNLTVFGFYKTTTAFTIRFFPKSDGLDSVVNASAGTVLKGKWRFRTDEEGISWISDEVEIEAMFLMRPFIVGTLTKAHEKILDRMVEMLKN